MGVGRYELTMMQSRRIELCCLGVAAWWAVRGG